MATVKYKKVKLWALKNYMFVSNQVTDPEVGGRVALIIKAHI